MAVPSASIATAGTTAKTSPSASVTGAPNAPPAGRRTTRSRWLDRRATYSDHATTAAPSGATATWMSSTLPYPRSSTRSGTPNSPPGSRTAIAIAASVP